MEHDSSTAPDDPIRLDSASLKALAHPLRLDLLRALRAHGADTASGLGRRLGESSGATSYHLRQLERHGFVEEDRARGTGRDRWWRAVHRMTTWRDSEFDADPAAVEALDVLGRYRLQSHVELLERWLGERASWPAAWRDAVLDDDYLVRLPAERMAELAEEVRAVVRRYLEAAPAPGAEDVTLLLYGVPWRGPEPTT